MPVKAALPARLKEVNHRVRSSQAQWFFDDPRLHFEAWWHANSGRLELGLHLEATPALNERIAAGLARQLLMIKARLGQQLDLEPWDRGWIRLYETYPVELNLPKVDVASSNLVSRSISPQIFVTRL
ncbi:MAG: hypothetical protein E6I31_07560 [Chloroflexi bacterium]|nr:MAG: hypothetical protein E6I31_07560 [Chloroflexota bacterium]